MEEDREYIQRPDAGGEIVGSEMISLAIGGTYIIKALGVLVGAAALAATAYVGTRLIGFSPDFEADNPGDLELQVQLEAPTVNDDIQYRTTNGELEVSLDRAA
tara:strand:+ start:103 stop:411 length:309 start_codon:yes stop_codon:yes gene_type:complete